ncbi:metallophosphoesterase family protein [Alicyclobacillus kakegawensis]|uniref:metallophosphoesterase family protein n=1 Tax=Alicyclobacillus kakegawensis TaxID=392012 RepID=UPI000AFEF762|nr:metallophosphoesterase family protein [Alicyclobacillus kakegawensis]
MAMQKVAAIYDIHGNLPALEAVLEDICRENVDCIIVGGDVAWGPDPAGVMDCLLRLPGDVRFLRGNADREVAGRYGVEQGLEQWVAQINQWCADQLNDAQLAFLRKLPEKVSLHIDRLGSVLFVHGSPRSDEEAIREDTSESEIRPMLEGVTEDIVVCGHTHVQFDRRIGGKRVINPGSVGLQSSARGACWALFGPDVELRETSYDVKAAAERILRTGVPMAEEFAQHVLNPPMKGP